MAAVNRDVYNIANDINGDYYVVGQQGELEEELAHRHVYICQTDRAVFSLGTIVDAGANIVAINRTININYWALRSITGPHAVSPEEARKIAYLRVFALVKGLGDPTDNRSAHNVRYNDVKIIDDTDTFPVIETAGAAAVDRGMNDDIPGIGDDDAWRAIVKKKVTNMICMVAYFMRVRGHHWTADSDDRYKEVWRLCLYEEDTPGLDWEKIAHHAFHFIYPDTLDLFWLASIEAKRCAGTLDKRYDSAAAGTAVITAVYTGAQDLILVFPRIGEMIPNAFRELDRCMLALQNHRWAGSINRRFYNGPDLTCDEKKIGALAAVIVSALEAVAGSARLRNSPALRRAAQNAPITGSLMVAMITKAAQSDRMINALFYEEDEDT